MLRGGKGRRRWRGARGQNDVMVAIIMLQVQHYMLPHYTVTTRTMLMKQCTAESACESESESKSESK